MDISGQEWVGGGEKKRIWQEEEIQFECLSYLSRVVFCCYCCFYSFRALLSLIIFVFCFFFLF